MRTGPLGWLVGHLIAVKTASRSHFALALLAPGAGEHILEIGFGSGVDLRRLLAAVGPTGKVTGVELSPVMLAEAARRNRPVHARGHLRLVAADAVALPFRSASFDAVYSVNSAHFWPDLNAGVAGIAEVLRPGGRALIAVQPRGPGAEAGDARRWADRLDAAFCAAGFAEVVTQLAPLLPTPMAAVLGRRPLTPPCE